MGEKNKQLTWGYYYKWKEENNIPDIPEEEQDNEFVSTADLLGYVGSPDSRWTQNKKNLIVFLEEVKNSIDSMSNAELILLLSSTGLDNRIKMDDGFSGILRLPTNERKDAIEDYIQDLKDEVGIDDVDDDDEENLIDELNDNTDLTIAETDDVDSVEDSPVDDDYILPVDKVIENLKLMDSQYINIQDQEMINFMISNRVDELWDDHLNTRNITDEGGKYFTTIKNMFFNELKETENIGANLPPDYCFEFQPNLMQLLTCLRLKQHKVYGNWSDVGAGKTLSAVLAGRYLKLKNVLVITFNSTKEGWKHSIESYFNNSNVYVDYTKNLKLPENQYNYLVLNYEFFQTENAEFKLNELLSNNNIDYLILDEVHSVKQRIFKIVSKRRGRMVRFIDRLRESNDNLHLITMTATPIINNLYEGKKLFELIYGEKFDDYPTQSSSVNDCLKFHMLFKTHGMRNKMKYDIDVNYIMPEIDGNHLLNELQTIDTDLDIEKILFDDKFECYKKYIKSGTVIFTYYVDEIVEKLKENIEALGLTVGVFTGTEKEGLDDFRNQKVDVLIGSSPIGTGVDGIQKVSNRLICHSMPWTSSEFNQLKGRLIRQGSEYNKVDIIIPKVIVEYINPKTNEIVQWSRDIHKLKTIKYKHTVFSVVMDGKVPKEIIIDIAKLKRKSIKSLESLIERVNTGELVPVKREQTNKTYITDVEWIKIKRELGDFSKANRDWSIKKSSTLHKEIKENPTIWKGYHKMLELKQETWNEIPYQVIANKINRLNRVDITIADLGCGLNKFKDEVENQVFSFDHYAIDNTVISCDISEIPLKDAQVDVAVLSLSLMGSNSSTYLNEAYRILQGGGYIFIAEPKAKWINKMNVLTDKLNEIGFRLVGDVDIHEKFIYIHACKV